MREITRAFWTSTILCIWLCTVTGSLMAEEAPSKGTTAKEASDMYRYTNRLVDSNDPYLLLHAHNPVDWYPWGPEALTKAKRENKPIFLSIGYSTCYWCHVAEKTIYSLPEFAELMNPWFVNIKVDREQRPDIDRIYMLATQLMTQSGGWPNNLFLTPDLKPFYAGSYFPPHDDSFGRPGFSTILKAIHEAWQKEPKRILDTSEQVYTTLQHYQEQTAKGPSSMIKPQEWLANAVSAIPERFDRKHGGFSSSNGTKFPQEPFLELLLANYQIRHNPKDLEGLKKALDAMAYGGVYDQVGWGFHRYSMEPTWSIPHFEKMLYDNAQLVKIYAEAYQAMHNAVYRQVASQVADYLTQQMMAPEGGFYTAQDAEVNGEEGASYLWTREEIISLLGPNAAKKFFNVYALTPMPHQSLVENMQKALKWEEKRGVLRIRLPIEQTLKRARAKDVVQMLTALEPLRKKLLEVRNRRPQPLRDEKIVSGLNGLAIEGLTVSGQILHKPEYIAAAKHTAERIWVTAYSAKTVELKHEIFKGHAQTDGYLDDYAFLGRGYMALYEATKEEVWRNRAISLADSMLKRFTRADGTLATTTAEKDLLIIPPDDGDNVIPSGVSAAVDLLLRLSALPGESRYAFAASRMVDHLSGQLQQHPLVWPIMIAVVNVNKFNPGTAATEAAASLNAGNQGASNSFQQLNTADYVRVSGKVLTKPDHEEILVTVGITDGYHINANPASYDNLIPTSVSFEGLTSLRVNYPKPILFKAEFAPEGLNVYEGKVNLVAQFPKGTLKKGQTIRATVAAQACNDKICLPPAKLPLSIPVLGHPSGR